MREIVLDTETTGLSPAKQDNGEWHRIVEIGCIELQDGVASGRNFHRYLNPERDVPEDAYRIHGLNIERLRSEPRFADIAEEFLAFLGEARLVIHNAEFDLGFLNMELKHIGHAPINESRVVDTLPLARRELSKRGYGGPYSLDALCKRFKIAGRPQGLHGALLDADLLTKVYLQLLGVGEQLGFGLASSKSGGSGLGLAVAETTAARTAVRERGALPSGLSEEEKEAHRRFVATLGKGRHKTLWDCQDL